MFEQEFNTEQLTITDSNFIVSPTSTKTVRITPCREYHITALTPILNLILHIVYKWEFVSFLEPNKNTPRSPLEKVMRVLGECVHDGGYNVASVILSFLSPAHLPIQITPTRWKRDPEDIIARLRARFEENNMAKDTIIDKQRVVIDEQRADIHDLLDELPFMNKKRRRILESMCQVET